MRRANACTLSVRGIRPSFAAVTEFVHHAITAGAIVGATYLATVSGWLELPDGLWLSALQRFAAVDTSPAADNSVPSIVVATIGPAAYTTDFEATSPLRRPVVAAHLDRWILDGPSGIAIDLDLVPPVCVSEADDLDRTLDGALSRGVQVFLIAPLGIGGSDETCTRRWMTARCESGVMFGYPDVQRRWGATLRYAEAYPSLGRVVRQWFDDGGPRFGGELKGRGLDSTPGESGRLALQERSELCVQLRSNVGLETIRDSLWEAAQHAEAPPIDMRAGFPCRELTLPQACSRERAGLDRVGARVLSSAPWPKSLQRQVVFLGGAYDPKDTLATSVGSVTGVVVHAAIARSNLRNVGHGRAFLIELVGGGLLGWALLRLWRRLYDAHAQYQRLVTASAFSWRGALRSLTHVIRSVAMIIGACLGFLSAATIFSWNELAKGVWLSPAPMALGMLIDTAINAASRHEHHSLPADHRLQRALFQAPGLFVKLCIFLYSIWHLGSHAF